MYLGERNSWAPETKRSLRTECRRCCHGDPQGFQTWPESWDFNSRERTGEERKRELVLSQLLKTQMCQKAGQPERQTRKFCVLIPGSSKETFSLQVHCIKKNDLQEIKSSDYTLCRCEFIPPKGSRNHTQELNVKVGPGQWNPETLPPQKQMKSCSIGKCKQHMALWILHRKDSPCWQQIKIQSDVIETPHANTTEATWGSTMEDRWQTRHRKTQRSRIRGNGKTWKTPQRKIHLNLHGLTKEQKQ